MISLHGTFCLLAYNQPAKKLSPQEIVFLPRRYLYTTKLLRDEVHQTTRHEDDLRHILTRKDLLDFR